MVADEELKERLAWDREQLGRRAYSNYPKAPLSRCHSLALFVWRNGTKGAHASRSTVRRKSTGHETGGPTNADASPLPATALRRMRR